MNYFPYQSLKKLESFRNFFLDKTGMGVAGTGAEVVGGAVAFPGGEVFHKTVRRSMLLAE